MRPRLADRRGATADERIGSTIAIRNDIRVRSLNCLSRTEDGDEPRERDIRAFPSGAPMFAAEIFAMLTIRIS